MATEIKEYLTKREMKKVFRILDKAGRRIEKKRRKKCGSEKSVLYFNCQYGTCNNDGRTDYQCWQTIADILEQIMKHCQERGCPYANGPVEGIDEEFPEGWE